MRANNSALLAAALLALLAAPLQAQNKGLRPSSGAALLRQAELCNALAKTASRILPELHRAYLRDAARFGKKAALVEARAREYLARAEPSSAMLKAAAAACRRAGESERATRIETWAADPARIKPAAAAEFVEVGRDRIGQREVIQRLRFDDPSLAARQARSLAEAALAAGLEGPAKIRALALAGKLTEAKSAAMLAKSPAEAVEAGRLAALDCDAPAAEAHWAKAIAADPSLAAAVAAARAATNIGLIAALPKLEAELAKRRAAAGMGVVGLRRHRDKNRDLLWSLALLRAAAGRGSERAGVDALSALEIAESQFPAGARGELFQHPDPRFPVILGDLYIQAHRYREALSYVYDMEALPARLPLAAAVREALLALSAMEALGADDAKLSEGQGSAPEQVHYGALVQAQEPRQAPGTPGAPARSSEPRAAPSSGGQSAWLIIGVGLLLLACAGWAMRS